MPEIHIVNGKPRQCSDAITARGLTEEWLKDPEGTEAKVAKQLAAEADARAKNAAPRREPRTLIEDPTAENVAASALNNTIAAATSPEAAPPARARRAPKDEE